MPSLVLVALGVEKPPPILKDVLKPRNLVPEGIEAVVGYDPDRVILARGTPGALAELQSLIQKLDVVYQTVRLEARFSHYSRSSPRADRFLASGSGISQTRSGGTLGGHSFIGGIGLDREFTPHVNRDGTVSLDIRLRITNGASTHDVKMAKKVRPGERVPLLAVRFPREGKMQRLRLFAPEKAPAVREEGYYLEIMAALVPEPLPEAAK
jgi:hypothetical protein